MKAVLKRYKKIILLSILPVLLSVVNCYIYLDRDSLILGLVPLSWRICITSVVWYLFILWPLLREHGAILGRNRNVFCRVLHGFAYCCGLTCLVHAAMIFIYWVVLIGGLAIYYICKLLWFLLKATAGAWRGVFAFF